jgi:GAF domain-containing protein
MSTNIHISVTLSKEEKYLQLLPQIKGLLESESDTIANMANVSAVLKSVFNFLWVGFYIVKQDELVLGPFQGNVACTRIKYGKGVCGTAWKEQRTVVVPDVHSFEGHIMCDSASVSELVVPIIRDNQVVAVLDIDSEHLAHFDETDTHYLQIIVDMFNVKP